MKRTWNEANESDNQHSGEHNPATPPRSPWQVTSSTAEGIPSGTTNCGYPLYSLVQEQAVTPMKLARQRHRYDFVVYAGFGGDDVHPLLRKDGLWVVKEAACVEDDTHIEYNGAALEDVHGKLVVKLRTVIDKTGNFLLTENYRGSTKTPFHHQITLGEINIESGTVNYQDVKNFNDNVPFAGELGFGSDGLIYYVSNKSGHYQPGKDCFTVIKDFLSLHAEELADKVIIHNVADDFFDVEEKSAIKARSTALSSDKRDFFVIREITKIEIRAETEGNRSNHRGLPSFSGLLFPPGPQLDLPRSEANTPALFDNLCPDLARSLFK